jgi:hypothetical protein
MYPFFELLRNLSGTAHHGFGAPTICQYSSKRLLYTAIDGTCKNTIGGAKWENF